MAKSKYPSKKSQKKSGIQNMLSMPLLLVLAGIVLVGGALFAVWKAGQPSSPKVAVEVKGSPSLKVDQDKVDLGDVKLGRTVSVSFQLANVGDETLRFSDKPYVEVREGC